MPTLTSVWTEIPSKKGIRIKNTAFNILPSAFVLWLDRTYPNTSGDLSIHKKGDDFVFKYRGDDFHQALTNFDRLLIRQSFLNFYNRRNDRQKDIEWEDNVVKYVRGGEYQRALEMLRDKILEAKKDEGEEF